MLLLLCRIDNTRHIQQRSYNKTFGQYTKFAFPYFFLSLRCVNAVAPNLCIVWKRTGMREPAKDTAKWGKEKHERKNEEKEEEEEEGRKSFIFR